MALGIWCSTRRVANLSPLSIDVKPWRMSLKSFTPHSLPVIVPRGTPLPPSQVVPLYQLALPPLALRDRLERARLSAVARLDREWEVFVAGRSGMVWRARSMRRYHQATVALMLLEVGILPDHRPATASQGREQTAISHQRSAYGPPASAPHQGSSP